VKGELRGFMRLAISLFKRLRAKIKEGEIVLFLWGELQNSNTMRKGGG